LSLFELSSNKWLLQSACPFRRPIWLVGITLLISAKGFCRFSASGFSATGFVLLAVRTTTPTGQFPKMSPSNNFLPL
jgi:hypothetical protein